MNQLRTALKFLGWYVSMALGGAAMCGLFALLRFRVFQLGYDKDSVDPLVVIMEMTAAMMSGVLITGRIYCRYLPCDDIADMNRFMNWRIQLLHVITIVAVLVDLITRR